jgi:dienelactone hydrolase
VVIARRGRPRRVAGAFLTAVLLIVIGLAPPVSAVPHTGRDCAGDLGDPISGTADWDTADLNNQQCAQAGLQMIRDNPALAAAVATNAAAGHGAFVGDPFRAPNRWADTRGSYALTAFTASDGTRLPAALFGPRDLDAGPYPGVLLLCHACVFATTEDLAVWYWAAEALAESGYVVMYAAIAGNSAPRAVDATDFFVATPGSPSRGQVNPWHASLDRSRLGVVGHSGAAGVALTVGHGDRRFDAVVAWDPAGSFDLTGVTPRVPTMVQVADYRQEAVPPPRHERPVPTLPKFTFYDTVSAAGVDTMQVALRASTHFEWARGTIPGGGPFPFSIHGEIVATYYTLAWFDRYLAPARIPGAGSWSGHVAVPDWLKPHLSRAIARDALRRLTATGTRRFDRSADVHSIGTGSYDARKAQRGGNTEAGNVPITIGGLRIRNLLSFQYDSRYSLDGGALRCADMRAGCP